MFCPYCGHPVDPAAAICPSCNAAIPDTARPSQYTSPELATTVNPSRKRIVIVAVGAIVLALAVLTFVAVRVFGIPDDLSKLPGPFGGGQTHSSTNDVSDTLYQVDIDLGKLATNPLDEAEALDGFSEFKLRGKTTYTKNDHMVDLVRYRDYDTEVERETADSYDNELQSTPIWHLQLRADDEDIGLDKLRSGTKVTYVSFNGEEHGKTLTCGELASLVSELYEHDGITLYKHRTGENSYTIEGVAVNEKTAASISYYSYVYDDRNNNSLNISATPIDANGMRYMKQFARYRSNDHLFENCDDSLVVDVRSDSLRKLIDENYDPVAFEEELRSKSNQIGNSYDMPFDLSAFAENSPDTSASMMAPLFESTQVQYKNDVQERSYYYTANAEMAAAMGLDADGDGKSDKQENPISSAPWYLNFYDRDYKDLSRSDIGSGKQIYATNLTTTVSCEKPTLRDVANLIRQVYNFDKIVAYSDRYTGNINGIAIQGNSVARFDGYDSGTWGIGLYNLYASIYNANDDGLGKMYRDDFDEEYNNDKLKNEYADVYFE